MAGVCPADEAGRRQFAPSWHPDGKRLIFASNIHGEEAQFRRLSISLDGSGLERVTLTRRSAASCFAGRQAPGVRVQPQLNWKVRPTSLLPLGGMSGEGGLGSTCSSLDVAAVQDLQPASLTARQRSRRGSRRRRRDGLVRPAVSDRRRRITAGDRVCEHVGIPA